MPRRTSQRVAHANSRDMPDGANEPRTNSQSAAFAQKTASADGSVGTADEGRATAAEGGRLADAQATSADAQGLGAVFSGFVARNRRRLRDSSSDWRPESFTSVTICMIGNARNNRMATMTMKSGPMTTPSFLLAKHDYFTIIRHLVSTVFSHRNASKQSKRSCLAERKEIERCWRVSKMRHKAVAARTRVASETPI